MPAPKNHLKAALAAGDLQLGLWLDSGDAVTAELAAGVGFDWCLIDGEHAPFDPTAIAAQLRAIALGGASAVVRVPVNVPWVLKQVLDLGAQTVLVPMVNTAEEARAAVAACRYPPKGARGLAAGVVRASGYGKIGDYATTADAEICVLVQAETREALENLDAILGVEGVDGVFIGPSDLSADMGFLGQPQAPEVVAAIDAGIATIRAAGKAAGIIHYDADLVARYIGLGVTFLGVGADVSILRAALADRLARARAAGKG